MSKFKDMADAASTDEKMPSFGYAPANCKCGRTAVVSMLTCTNKNTGVISQAPASTFCGRDNHNNPTRQLMDWWEFMKWDSWCPECWSREPIPTERKYTDAQVRKAWRWLLGETCRGDGALSGVFPPLALSDAHRDMAIEIVNYEAKRCGNTGSVPEQYRI